MCVKNRAKNKVPYLAKNQHFKGACRKCFNAVVDERNKKYS